MRHTGMGTPGTERLWTSTRDGADGRRRDPIVSYQARSLCGPDTLHQPFNKFQRFLRGRNNHVGAADASVGTDAFLRPGFERLF